MSLNHKAVMTAVMAVCLGASALASAQGDPRRYDGNGRPGYDQRGPGGGPGRDDGRPGDGPRGDGPRGYGPRGDGPHGDFRGGPGPDRAHWGAGPRHDMRRGDRLAAEYRSRQYVVDDWRGHRLSRPPRGYHWVQTGGDYVLVAIASGVIAQILLDNY